MGIIMSLALHVYNKHEIESNTMDIELIRAFKSGDDYAFNSLLDHYLITIRIYAKQYFAPGLTESDLIQEGRIGLYKAVLSFQIDRGTIFKGYARLHIKSRMINAVKVANRKKQQILSNSLSLDEQLTNNDVPVTRYDFIFQPEPSPEDIFVEVSEGEYRRGEFRKRLKGLSNLEKEVLKLWIQEMSYKDVANHLDISPKSVDNAMSRILKKCSGKIT